MDGLKHKPVYLLLPLLIVSGATASSAARIGNEFAAAQLVLGSWLVLDHTRVATDPGDGAQAVMLTLKQNVQFNSTATQATATAPVRAEVGRHAEAHMFRFTRKDDSSGKTETQAELRQHDSNRDHHPARSLRSNAPGQHQLRSTLLTELGPAGSPVSVEANAQPPAQDGTEVDSRPDQKQGFKLDYVSTYVFDLPATVTVEAADCEADLQATVRPPAQGHSFIYGTTSHRGFPGANNERNGAPTSLHLLTNQLITLSDAYPNLAPLSHNSCFAGEGSGGDTFFFLNRQAAHTQASGSAQTTPAEAATLKFPMLTHADPHLTAIPSPAKYSYPSRVIRKMRLSGSRSREAQKALIVYLGADLLRASAIRLRREQVRTGGLLLHMPHPPLPIHPPSVQTQPART
jgi:hypothetical protein